MLVRLWTSFFVLLGVATAVAWVIAFMHEKGIRPVREFVSFFKKKSRAGRVVLGALFIGFLVFASVKPGDGGGNGGGGDGGGTNNLEMVVGPGGGLLPGNTQGSATNNAQSGLQGGILPGGGTGTTGVPPVESGNPASAPDEWENFPPITSTNTTRTLTGDDFRRGFVLARVGTGEQFDFSAPPDAVVCSDWRAFGAATDWIYVAFTNWAFQVGTNEIDRLRVYAFGKVEPLVVETDNSIATNYWFVPFMSSLGIVPEANWDGLAESDRPSQLWHCVTPSNTLQVTWQNALLGRDTDTPLSFQIEFKDDGQFIFRYDLSRCGGRGATALPDGVITNLLSGASFAGNSWATNSLPTNVTSMTFCPLAAEDAYNPDSDGDGLPTIDELFVYHTDPHNADTDYDGLTDYEELFVYGTNPLDPHSAGEAYGDGLAVRLGGVDPFSCPEGSTNTVLEHVFYSGTTNGAFAYPQPDGGTAILKVMVSGSGAGRLVVGDSVVPLVAPPQMRGGAATNTLLLAVGRGVRRAAWFAKPDGLDAAVASGDFLIGEMPSPLRPRGWLAFPHVEATVPCIHDFNTKSKFVSLVHGEEFPGMTATWDGGDPDVVISNAPPVSAGIGGNFPKDQARSISYTVDHPNRLNDAPVTIAQQLRFCPHVAPEDEPAVFDLSAGGIDYPETWGDDPPPQALDDDDAGAEEAFTNIVDGAFQPLADVLYLYRDNTRTESLEVPGEVCRCCPCPEHWNTNYVAKVSYTENVGVADSAGNDFSIAYEPCTVTLRGISPSRDFGDSHVNFVTNGAPYKGHGYTVLGVGFKPEDGRASLSNYNHRSSSLGYPVAVCTNAGNAGSVILKTDVLLSNGVVRVSLEDAAGDIALWLPEWTDDDGMGHPAELLLGSGVRTSRHFTIGQWRGVMGRYHETRTLALKVLSSRPGSCRVRFDFAASDGAHFVHDYAEQRITAVKPPLLADYNWDFSADAKDALDQGNGRKLYFWTNHDTWRDDDAFAPYSEGYHLWPMTLPENGADMVVNGRNDLVNLCPLAVDLSKFVHAWGTAGVQYVFYTGSPGNIRFVPVRTKWNKLDGLVKEDQKTILDEDLHSAALLATSVEDGRESGYVLPPESLSLGASGTGILAVEFAAEGLHTLRIAVKDGGSGDVLFDSPVAIRALDVHKMYRWLDLGGVCGVTNDLKYAERLTVQWPDSEHADANVVFVHGYNMHPSEAWDWSQAMFKRLRWSGMDAGFTAVLWRGNESQMWIPKIPFVGNANGYATPNYHQNVLNAFRTAGAFATKVNTKIPGAKKYMIAHSLGNMLVSAARQFHGLQYDQYFMLNAAVALEAYDPVGGVTTNSWNDMTPAEWRPYPNRVRPTHWHELFLSNPNDERRNLTWKGIFKDVDNTINFYSSKDEVVANGNDEVEDILTRDFAWYNQEQKKGSLLVSFNPQAGWKFGNHYLKKVSVGYWNGEDQYVYMKYEPEETASIADTNLMVRPFFKDFRDEQIYGEGGSEFLQTNDMVRWYAFSHGIPVESFAAGANPVQKWKADERNINMARECKPRDNNSEDSQTELAEGDDEEKEVNWIHSYFISKSLFETQILYGKLVKQIGSTKPSEETGNE